MGEFSSQYFVEIKKNFNFKNLYNLYGSTETSPWYFSISIKTLMKS